MYKFNLINLTDDSILILMVSISAVDILMNLQQEKVNLGPL